MRSKDIIVESLSTNILIVDVQPAYDPYCKRVVGKIADLINNHRGNITVLYNAEGMTNDTEYDVISYFEEHGVEYDNLEKLNMVEKEYGFFRGWMDNGVDDRIILKIIRAMVTQRVNDSRDLNLEEILGDDFDSVPEYDSIYMPDFMSLGTLRNMSPFYMCGGGRTECLREIELICNAFNIRYKRMNNLIYG
jgi:hypothetical protein